MDFNSNNIRQYKGRLICMRYLVKSRNGRDSVHSITGEITATSKYHILFNSGRSGHEISLIYSQIQMITDPEKTDVIEMKKLSK